MPPSQWQLMLMRGEPGQSASADIDIDDTDSVGFASQDSDVGPISLRPHEADVGRIGRREMLPSLDGRSLVTGKRKQRSVRGAPLRSTVGKTYHGVGVDRIRIDGLVL